MSDPVSNAEIEDVLSSIRRLVSEDPGGQRRRKAERAAEASKFVLTPALRVTEPAADAAAEDQAEAPQSDPPSGNFFDMTLEQRIAQLEAAIGQSREEWEPDGSEAEETDETRPLSADAGGVPDFSAFEIAVEPEDGDDQEGAEKTVEANAWLQDPPKDAPEDSSPTDEGGHTDWASGDTETEQASAAPEGGERAADEVANRPALFTADAPALLDPVEPPDDDEAEDLSAKTLSETDDDDQADAETAWNVDADDRPDAETVWDTAGDDRSETETVWDTAGDDQADTETAGDVTEDDRAEGATAWDVTDDDKAEGETAQDAEDDDGLASVSPVAGVRVWPQPTSDATDEAPEGGRAPDRRVDLEASFVEITGGDRSWGAGWEDAAPEEHSWSEAKPANETASETADETVDVAAVIEEARVLEEVAAPDDAPADDEDADETAEDQGQTAQDIEDDDEARVEETVFADRPETAEIDEEALRDLVADLVRSELQGVLGERITRNVRRLIRQEIHKALAVRDLD